MTTPSNTEGLTAEQIEWLRKLTSHDQPGRELESDECDSLRDTLAGQQPGLYGSYYDMANRLLFRRTRLADTLIATIDRLIDAERERVLAEINKVADRLPTFVATRDSLTHEWHLDEYHRDRMGPELSGADTFTEALLAAAPQENNQEGAG